MDKNTKIGIIGAGPSGLSAAEALRDNGYTNVIILERSARPGGMTFSKEYVDPATRKKFIYELGSLMPVGANVGHFADLLSRYDLHLGKGPDPNRVMKGAVYSLEQQKNLIDYKQSKIGYSYTKILHAFVDLNKIRYCFRKKLSNLSKPGFANLTTDELKELSQPYEDWIDSKEFWIIGPETKFVMGSILGFCNPTYKNKISALYMVKLMMQFAKPPRRYLNGEFQFLREGYQELWNRIAKQHNIHYKSNIQNISRSDNHIKITTDHEVITVDKLIISCSPEKTKQFLDLTDEERGIFNKIIYCPGTRAVFKAKGMPHDGFYGLLEPYYDEKLYPCILAFFPEAQLDDNTWLYGATFSGESLNDMKLALTKSEEILRNHFNAYDIQWVDQCHWHEYNPHFSCEDVADHIYERYEGLQGKHKTYYTGGAIAGGTNPVVIDYSYDLVQRMMSGAI